jgi:SNF2 family DNA or RNA helicase
LTIKTPQLPHQEEIYRLHRDDESYGLFHEMGLGKTKVFIDVAAHLFSAHMIDCLLAVAPNSVYRNWLTQEMPLHCGVPYTGMAYPKNDDSALHHAKREVFLDRAFHPGKLRFLCVSYDSLKTKHGFAFVEAVLRRFRCMMVADESTAIANPETQQTKVVKKLGKLARYRWIGSGAPVADSAFKIHSQIDFLDPDFWSDYGVRSYSAFKRMFGVFEPRRVGARSFMDHVGYRNLDRLTKMIAPISSRLLKEDSTVRLPPKTYCVRTFEMLPAQRRAYDELVKRFETELESGQLIEAPLAIVRITRLQQIASGFVSLPSDDPDEPSRVTDVVTPGDNPRLQLLLELIEEAHHKVIVWCRFTRDVDVVCAALGDLAVRYDGRVTDKRREEALTQFREGSPKVFVANTAAISHGVTLVVAKTMIYYSHHPSLEKRLQSEDRAHRIGQDKNLLIVDIAAERSVDGRMIQILREKYELAATVMGDRFREWLRPVDASDDG